MTSRGLLLRMQPQAADVNSRAGQHAAEAKDRETLAQLIAARSAVAAALGYVEDEAIRVRSGHPGADVQPGDGVIAAGYRHRISGSLDPQLHMHVVCANVARGSVSRWTALDARAIYQHARTAGFVPGAPARRGPRPPRLIMGTRGQRRGGTDARRNHRCCRSRGAGMRSPAHASW